MKINKTDGKTVFVISGGGGGCPRLLVEPTSTALRDDYHGKVKVAKGLLSKLSSL